MPAMIVPALRLSDPSLVDWLADAFELQITERTVVEGQLVHVELWLGEWCLMASTAGRFELPTGVASIYLALPTDDDVHRRFARARDAGAEVVMEPTPMDYGGINATVRDADGNLWSLGTFVPQAP